MSKIAVVYWSGTGNTEAMATAVAEGITGAGGEAALLTAAEFDPALVDSFDAIAFGCPSMGSEELEESEFAPMFEGCEPKLKGKKIALFGSYGWGDGQWMRDWEDRCTKAGANLFDDGLILCGMPDADGKANCKAYGERFAAY